MTDSIIDALRNVLPESILAHQPDKDTNILSIRRESLVEVARFLKDSPGSSFKVLMDIVGVDYMGKSPRFEIVYVLYSLESRNYLRLKVQVPEDDCEVDSLCGVWRGANWHEREVYDLFGIRFRGHPNMRRILCHDEFVGHALRKDYDIKKGQWLSRPYDPR